MYRSTKTFTVQRVHRARLGIPDCDIGYSAHPEGNLAVWEALPSYSQTVYPCPTLQRVSSGRHHSDSLKTEQKQEMGKRRKEKTRRGGATREKHTYVRGLHSGLRERAREDGEKERPAAVKMSLLISSRSPAKNTLPLVRGEAESRRRSSKKRRNDRQRQREGRAGVVQSSSLGRDLVLAFFQYRIRFGEEPPPPYAPYPPPPPMLPAPPSSRSRFMPLPYPFGPLGPSIGTG